MTLHHCKLWKVPELLGWKKGKYWIFYAIIVAARTVHVTKMCYKMCLLSSSKQKKEKEESSLYVIRIIQLKSCNTINDNTATTMMMITTTIPLKFQRTTIFLYIFMGLCLCVSAHVFFGLSPHLPFFRCENSVVRYWHRVASQMSMVREWFEFVLCIRY